jgi:chromate reductase
MRILAISGSLRDGSHNTELLRAAAAGAPEGVEVELYEPELVKQIPPYDADDDGAGDQPVPVRRL